MVEVLIGDLPMDPKASTGNVPFVARAGRRGWGQGNPASFYTKKISTNSGALKRKALSFVTSLLRNNRYANINCPQTWECESGAFFVHIHPFFILPPFFFSLAQASSQSEFKSCIEETSGGGNYAKATCMAYFYAF